MVVTGVVSDAAQVLPESTVRVRTDCGWIATLSDGAGMYTVTLDSPLDTVMVCVASPGHNEACSTVVPGDVEVVEINLQLKSAVFTDTIWLSIDTVAAGETAEILVNVSNPDSAIAGMNLWLNPQICTITYDTIAPVTPRFPASGMEWSAVEHPDENIMALLFIDFQNTVYISPGRGPVMKISYKVDASTPAGSYTVFSQATSGVPRAYDLSYRSGLTMPDVLFIPGAIVVQ